jgi:ribosomal protein S2
MKLGFLQNRLFKKFKLSRLLEFTLLQMLQHNVQLGASIRFSLLSSYWFIFGSYRGFAIIDLSQTVIHYRYFLDVIRYVTDRRRHLLFVNERRYTKFVVSDVAQSVGETYYMGR